MSAETGMPLIELRGVTKKYRGAPVVEDASVMIREGESVVIIGPSGAGKSTMLRCAAGLEPIDGGTVLYRGTEMVVPGKVARKVSGEIGMVFQQFNLFPHLTALQNMTLAPIRVRKVAKREAEAEGQRLLRKVGLADRAGHYPFELSGGQQQRLAIARALAMEPRLMLFDEPTSALDPEFTKEVLDVMRQLVSEGMTSIVVTHEMSFARQSSTRLVFMDGGRVIEEGATNEVFAHAQHPRTRKFLEQLLEP